VGVQDAATHGLDLRHQSVDVAAVRRDAAGVVSAQDQGAGNPEVYADCRVS